MYNHSAPLDIEVLEKNLISATLNLIKMKTRIIEENIPEISVMKDIDNIIGCSIAPNKLFHKEEFAKSLKKLFDVSIQYLLKLNKINIAEQDKNNKNMLIRELWNSYPSHCYVNCLYRLLEKKNNYSWSDVRKIVMSILDLYELLQ